MKNYISHIQNLVSEKAPNAKIIYLILAGSHLYGLNTEKSDYDFRGIYIQNNDDILSGNYIEEVKDEKGDICLYEIRKFLLLLKKSNPTVLEYLYANKENILISEEIMNELFELKNSFISKEVFNSFSNYAVSQIRKANSLEKQQKMEMNDVPRLQPKDFVYSISNFKKVYFVNNGSYALVKIPHQINNFKLYWSRDINPNYKGIQSNNSNDILKTDPALVLESDYLENVHFNIAEYSEHCKRYNNYLKWKNERNVNRWIENKEHKQLIDGKNMMHNIRLLEMSNEILDGKGLILKRPNREYLLSIRKGEVSLKDLIDYSMNMIEKLSKKDSNLPEKVDIDLKHIELKFRKIYGSN